MSDQSFPNSEQLFKEAFAASDPLPPLLQLLKEHPTYDTGRDLVLSYTDAVEENPSRAQVLASALARLRDLPDTPRLGTRNLTSLLNEELADYHFKTVYGDNVVKAYGRKNTYLLESLLSGLSLKNGLTATSDQLAAIDDGLNASPGTEKSEALAVGACIQLLLAGSKSNTESFGSYKKAPETVASKLKALKAASIVKDPHAIQVLELAIAHAESGFKVGNDRDDVWSLLFPSNL